MGITVSSSASTREDLVAEVGVALDVFEVFFTEDLHNDQPLTRAEKAIIKTFLFWAATRKSVTEPTAP